jgi:hypothetical protein
LAGNGKDEEKALPCLHVQLSRAVISTPTSFLATKSRNVVPHRRCQESVHGHVITIFLELTELFCASCIQSAFCEPHVAVSMENPTSQACIDDPGTTHQSLQHRHGTPRQRTHIDLDLLPVRVLNRGIIALDPDILDELCWQDGQDKGHQRGGEPYQ